MPYAKKPSDRNVPRFAVPRDDIGLQILNWVRGVVRSNNELVPALERLRSSYELLLAGKPVTDSEQVLWQVEGALMGAEGSKSALAIDALSGPKERSHAVARRGTHTSAESAGPFVK